MNKNRTVQFIILMFLFFRVNVVLGDTTFVHVIDFKNSRFSSDIELAIEYKDRKLNLFSRSRTVGEIFKELEKKAKIEIKVDEETAQKKVSIFVSGKTLKEGIEAVLNTIGQRDLAISYKEVTSHTSQVTSKTHDTSHTTQYEINKVEIRKRTKAEMEKVEAEEEEIRQEKYQKKEKWYHSLFKDMGTKGKLEGMLKDYAKGKVNNADIQTYLRQATIKPEEKPLLREALWDPKCRELGTAIQMALIHSIADNPEESDKEFIIQLLEKKSGILLMAMKFIWDERFIPGIIGILKDKTLPNVIRSDAAEILGVRKVREAVPALEEALVKMSGKENITHIHGALTDITGMTYKVVDGKAKAFPYETPACGDTTDYKKLLEELKRSKKE